VKTFWLVIREIISNEAFGIDRFYENGDEPWPGPNGMHGRLDDLLGYGKWTYSIITKAEWETFRDLHGFDDLGIKK